MYNENMHHWTRPTLERWATLDHLQSIKPNMINPLRQPIIDLPTFEKLFFF